MNRWYQILETMQQQKLVEKPLGRQLTGIM